MKIVLDTNVLVSALLTPSGAPARILDLIVSRQFVLLVDDRILLEYGEVLKRPKFRFEENQVEELIFYFDRIGEHVAAAPLSFSIPDRGDLPFLEVAVAGKADVLITGNKKDFGVPPQIQELKILSPGEFLGSYYKVL